MVSNEIKPNWTKPKRGRPSKPTIGGYLVCPARVRHSLYKKAEKVQQNATFGFNWVVVGLLITSPHNCVAHTHKTPTRRMGIGKEGGEGVLAAFVEPTKGVGRWRVIRVTTFCGPYMEPRLMKSTAPTSLKFNLAFFHYLL